MDGKIEHFLNYAIAQGLTLQFNYEGYEELFLVGPYRILYLNVGGPCLEAMHFIENKEVEKRFLINKISNLDFENKSGGKTPELDELPF